MTPIVAVPNGVAEFAFRPVEIIGVVFLRIHAFPSACPNSAEPWTLISNGEADKVGVLTVETSTARKSVLVRKCVLVNKENRFFYLQVYSLCVFL